MPGHPKQKISFESTSPAEALCTECGLCCTDVFHIVAYLEADDDIALLKKAGFSIIFDAVEKKYKFYFPCPAHNGVCSIYSDRPSVCRWHKCDLLRGLNDGTVKIEDALRAVHEIKALIEEILPELKTCVENNASNSPAVLMGEISKKLQNDQSKEKFKKDNAALLLKYGIFNFLKRKYFYKEDSSFIKLS